MIAWLTNAPADARLRPELDAYARAFGEVRTIPLPSPLGALSGVVSPGWRKFQFVKTTLPGALMASLGRALWGVPYVLDFRWDPEAVASALGRRKATRRWRWVKQLAMPRAALVIAGTLSYAEQALARGARRVERIPNGVDVEMFKPGIADSSQPIVLWAGRQSPEKNLGVLREAMARVPEARLVEVSGLAYDRMPATYRAASVFCLPSLVEGSPKALLEAAACGVPCVLSHAVEWLGPSLRWQAASGPHALAMLLRLVLARRDLARSLGEESRSYVVAHHDLRQILARELEAIREAL